MHDLDLARLIHEDREREIARNLRVHALRNAQKDGDSAFVPPPPDRRSRIVHAVDLAAGFQRGSHPIGRGLGGS